MDLQTCLKATLKNKYQKLSEANQNNFPSRICHRDLKLSSALFGMHQHEFNDCDHPTLQAWVALKTVPLTDILSCDCQHNSSQRTIITLGVSGAGKSTAVQRCALEWAEEKEYRHIHLLFVLTFWELNLIKHQLSLIELLQAFYPELKELDTSSLNENVWFVLDGLDECNLPLNFQCPTVTDVSERSTIHILLANLIMGNLLSSAHVWITARYAAAPQIPVCYLLKETEVQWISDKQKQQHFRTVVGSDDLANKAIDQVKISHSLDFLCRIPPICTILADFFKNLKEDEGFRLNPLTLTQVYSNLVKDSNSEIISKLNKLALLRTMEDNVVHVLYEDDLLKSDISVEEASSFSKEYPLVLREEKGLHNTTVFRFGHWSIQCFLAASAKLKDIELSSSRSLCCQYLVDKTLQSAEGKYDFFLRFVFGLIKESEVLDPSDGLFEYTKKKTLENSSVGLFNCLREYDSLALLNEVSFFLSCGLSIFTELTPRHFKLLLQKTSAFEGLDKSFQMQVSTRCDESLLRRLPDILKSKKAK